jgi:arabinose-5-phosphate isomerase
MEHRQFTPDHFRIFHPGGRLGAKLLKVRDLMHTDLPLTPATAPMSEALLAISRSGFGVTGITDPQGALTGIITDGDLRRHMDGLLTLTAGQVMTRTPRTVPPDALAEKALALMKDRKITCLFVLDPATSPQAIGILNIHDLLRAGVL